MSPGFAWGLVAGLAAAALFGVAAVAQAHAIRRQPHRPHGLVDFVRVFVRDPWTLGVVVAYLLVVVFLFIMINLTVDILYSVLDPRVRLAEVKG